MIIGMDRIQVLGPPRSEALSSERVNFVSAQNAVPVIQKLRVINKGAQDIETVRLSLGGCVATLADGDWFSSENDRISINLTAP